MTAVLANNQNGAFGFNTDAYVYPQFIGYAQRAPTTQDIYNPGTRWQDNSVNPPVIYQTTGAGIWYQDASAGGSFTSLTVTPGPINLTGTTNINTSGSGVTTIGTGGTGATNIGNSIGNTAVTGSLTSSTGLIATTGGITVSSGGAAITGVTTINTTGAAATSVGTGGTGVVNLGNATGGTAVTGNITWSSATQGPVQTAVSASGASPVATNARVFAATFTGVSIAAGATQSFVVQNTTITGSSTLVLYTMVGATTGSALNIQSITNASGQSTIVVENGTGATTSVANITFIGHVLN